LPRLTGNAPDGESTKLREELNWLYSRLARSEGEEGSALQKQSRDREKKLGSAVLRNQALAGSRTRTNATINTAKLQKNSASAMRSSSSSQTPALFLCLSSLTIGSNM
jgi:hypothetical protein